MQDRHSKQGAVRGVDLPGPRLTGWAWIYLGLYVGLPILSLGLLLDVAFYFLFERLFGVCYALLCVF